MGLWKKKENIKSKIKLIVTLYGLVYIFASTLMYINIWFSAFFSVEAKTLTTINSIGEMYPELILHIIGIPSALYLLVNLTSIIVKSYNFPD